MRRARIGGVALLVAAVCTAQVGEQELKRFAISYMSYYPGSVATLTENTQGTTPGGTYLAVRAERTTGSGEAKDQLGMLVDPTIRTVAAGLLFPVPPMDPPVTPDTLPLFVQQALPQALGNYLGSRVKVPWPMTPARPGAVLFLTAEVATGYGPMHMPVAISADGRYLVIGGNWPLDRDPRAVRREILSAANVQWDPGHEDAPVKVVEFSDFQCPSCKRGWGQVKPVLTTFGDKLRHGLVNWPIVSAHPWAFRAAVAGECLGALWPDRLLLLKEEFYRLQGSLTLDSVDPVVFGFLAQNGLDEGRFRACYLKDPSVDTVLQQMELGYRLGVSGTPTYFANGESLPWGETEVFAKRLQATLAASGRPEAAAEVVVTPKPTPTAGETAKH